MSHPLDPESNSHPLNDDRVQREPRSVVMLGFRPPQPVVTYALLALNVLLFAPYLLSPRLYYVLIEQGMNWRPGFLDGEVYRLLTAMFLHGSVQHILFNGLTLWSIGRPLEQLYGWRRYLAIYLLGGLFASLVSTLVGTVGSVGASGALFALFGAELVLMLRNRDVLGNYAQAQLRNLAFFGVLNLLIGILPGSNIDNWGHLGGFAAGVLLTLLAQPRVLVRPLTSDMLRHAAPPDADILPDESTEPQQIGVLIQRVTFDPRVSVYFAAFAAALLVIISGALLVMQ